MTPVEAYKTVVGLLHDGKPLELEQHALNALAMHDYARVHRFDAAPPLVAEVAVDVAGAWILVRRITPPPQPVHYEYRGLVCETHGQVAHRRARFASGPWACDECSPLPSEG